MSTDVPHKTSRIFLTVLSRVSILNLGTNNNLLRDDRSMTGRILPDLSARRKVSKGREELCYLTEII